MEITNSIAELKIMAANRGSHYFSADTLRFFSSRVHSRIYGCHYFVTSERDTMRDDPRAYTVRSFDVDASGPSTISFDTVGDFQAYSTRAEAHAAAQRLARQLWTFSDDEVRDITDAALTALAWSESLPIQVNEDGTVSLYDGTAPDADDFQPADSFGLDFSAAAIDTMTAEVRSFLALCADAEVPVRLCGDLSQIGHDMVLTQNGHGAGFWDRGNGVLGTLLTHWASTLGELHVYADADMLEIER